MKSCLGSESFKTKDRVISETPLVLFMEMGGGKNAQNKRLADIIQYVHNIMMIYINQT